MAAASPVNKDSLIIQSAGNDICAAVRAMTQAIAVLRADLDYRVDPDDGTNENTPQKEFASHLGAMILPPGTIMAFKVTSSSADAAALQTALDEAISAGWGDWGTEDEGDIPWWYICNGSHGTPNLVGRFIMGAGTVGAGDSAVEYANQSTGGATETTLDVDNLPNHDHLLGSYGTGGLAGGAGDGDVHLKKITPVTVAEFTGYDVTTLDSGPGEGPTTVVNTVTLGVNDGIEPSGEEVVAPVETLPPYVALVYAMRSTRMV